METAVKHRVSGAYRTVRAVVCKDGGGNLSASYPILENDAATAAGRRDGDGKRAERELKVSSKGRRLTPMASGRLH